RKGPGPLKARGAALLVDERGHVVGEGLRAAVMVDQVSVLEQGEFLGWGDESERDRPSLAVPLPCSSGGRSRVIDWRPGQRRERATPADVLPCQIPWAVPKSSLRAPQPATRHVHFEDDDALGVAAVAAGDVQYRPRGAGRPPEDDPAILRLDDVEHAVPP